jgi:hypothetical protein
MIISAILYILYGIVFLPIQLIAQLPDVSITGGIGASINVASQYLAGLNTFLPVTDILIILGAFLTYEIGYFAWKGINWLVRKIPTIS